MNVKREQDFTLYQKAFYFVKLSGKGLCFLCATLNTVKPRFLKVVS